MQFLGAGKLKGVCRSFEGPCAGDVVLVVCRSLGADKRDKTDVTQDSAIGMKAAGESKKIQACPGLAGSVARDSSIFDAHNRYSDANHYQPLRLRVPPPHQGNF